MKTIKQQHLEAIINSVESDYYVTGGSYIVSESREYAAEKCSAITEDVAIKFANWLLEKNFSSNGFGDWRSKYNSFSSRELYQIFKTENHLKNQLSWMKTKEVQIRNRWK